MSPAPSRKKRTPSRKPSAAAPQKTADSRPDGDTSKPESLFEWIAAAFGGLIVVSIIGYMVFLATTEDNGPPRFSIVPVQTLKQGDRTLVTFSADNSGDTTAAQVQVEGRLLDAAGQPVDEAQATIDFLPKGSQRTGGLIFARDPSGFTLDLRIVGYEDP